MKIYLSTGSNLGDREDNLKDAFKRLSNKIGEPLSSSPIYESEAMGFNGRVFLNQILIFDTTLEPSRLLQKLQQVERQMGRPEQKENYQDRIIDVDLLFYGSMVMHSTELTLPHPRLHERLFVLKPMDDVAPLFVHPVMELNIHTLLRGCEDTTTVERFLCSMTS